jgi:hypothetical protein
MQMVALATGAGPTVSPSPESPTLLLSCPLTLSLSLSLSLLTLHSPLFILLLLPLTTPPTHSRTTTRVCASPPCPPYVRCLGSYDGPEVMRRYMGSVPGGRSTMGMVLVKPPLGMRWGQV